MLTLHIPLAANASNDTEKTPCYLDFSGFQNSYYAEESVWHEFYLDLGFAEEDNIDWSTEIDKVALSVSGPGTDFKYLPLNESTWFSTTKTLPDGTKAIVRNIAVRIKQTGAGYCTVKAETDNGLTAERALYFEDYRESPTGQVYDNFTLQTFMAIMPKEVDSVVYSSYSFTYQFENDIFPLRNEAYEGEFEQTKYFFSDETMVNITGVDDYHRIMFTGTKEGVVTLYAVAPNGLTASVEFEIKAKYPETDTETNVDTDTSSDSKKYGDVDGNGRITARDSLKVLRYTIKLETLSDDLLNLADVNKDGKVNSKDAMAILRFTVGYNDKGIVINV